MKLKSYISNTAGLNQVREVRVVLAADASPGAGWTLLGDLIHEPVDDNASGMQKHDVSHVIYQHVQEQVYLKQGLQDMQRIKITFGGNFKPLVSVHVDQGENRLGIGKTATIKVTTVPANATHDGIVFAISNPELVDNIVNAGDGVLKFDSVGKGEIFVRVRVKGSSFEQLIPFEFTEE